MAFQVTVMRRTPAAPLRSAPDLLQNVLTHPQQANLANKEQLLRAPVASTFQCRFRHSKIEQACHREEEALTAHGLLG